MPNIQISVSDPKTKEDLEALWLGMPEGTLSKVEKLPQGIRDSLLQLAQHYALSAYKLGGIRQRQNCHEALQRLTEKVHPDGNLDLLLNPIPWA